MTNRKSTEKKPSPRRRMVHLSLDGRSDSISYLLHGRPHHHAPRTGQKHQIVHLGTFQKWLSIHGRLRSRHMDQFHSCFCGNLQYAHQRNQLSVRVSIRLECLRSCFVTDPWNYRKSNAALELIVDGNRDCRARLVYYLCGLGDHYSSLRAQHGSEWRVTLQYYRYFDYVSFDSWLFGSKYHQKPQKTWVPKRSKLDFRHRKFHLLTLLDGQLRYIYFYNSNCK